MDDKKNSTVGKKSTSNMNENLRRTLLGMPSSDPDNGTSWKDTLFIILLIVGVFVLFKIF